MRDLQQRLQRIASEITYKPWYRLQFEFEWHIETRHLQMHIAMRQPDATYRRKDEHDPVPVISIQTSKPVPPAYAGMTDDEIVELLFIEIEALERHEQGEWFRYKGVRTFDPHS